MSAWVRSPILLYVRLIDTSGFWPMFDTPQLGVRSCIPDVDNGLHAAQSCDACTCISLGQESKPKQSAARIVQLHNDTQTGR